MSKHYKKEEYYNQLEIVIRFIQDHGLKYLTDIDEHQECEAAVKWMLDSKRGPGFKITARYFASSVKDFRKECVTALKGSDLDSKAYRDNFAATFMKIIDNLTFIPTPRKSQIRKVVEGEKTLEDEKQCISLLQGLLYTILPKYYKVSAESIRELVNMASVPDSTVAEEDDDSSE